MSRDKRQRLRDLKDAIVAIREHLPAEVATRPARTQRCSTTRSCFVIGEAVKNLTAQTREAAPEIPWADIAGLRDLIAHEYFRIEMARVLEIVERDLPALDQAIGRLLDT